MPWSHLLPDNVMYSNCVVALGCLSLAIYSSTWLMWRGRKQWLFWLFAGSLTSKCLSNCVTHWQSRFSLALTFLSTRESRLTLSSPMSMAACLSSTGLRISAMRSLFMTDGTQKTDSLTVFCSSWLQKWFMWKKNPQQSKCGSVEITYLSSDSCVWGRFWSTSKRSSSEHLELLKCHLPKFRS